MIALVRESGGYGDVICMGAAARALRRERPAEPVSVFVPAEFADAARHLEGVDDVVSLGPLDGIRPHRRLRDSEITVQRAFYLATVFAHRPKQIVDLYCPGYRYEVSAPAPVYSRPQLFAMAAGARRCLDARPGWLVRQEESERAEEFLRPFSPPFIAFQPRATCAARSLSAAQAGDLARLLSTLGTVLWLDCIDAQPMPVRTRAPVVNISRMVVPDAAAVFQRTQCAVLVDSLFMHLAAAFLVPAVVLLGPTSGRAVTASYPRMLPIDGTSEACPNPCHYDSTRGWRRDECRASGCSRMASHGPEAVLERCRRWLAKEAAL